MVNYMAIAARCIVVEAQLENSALDRIAHNIELRCDERTNRIAQKQIRDALGNKKLKNKSTRQDAKWVLYCLEKHFPNPKAAALPEEPEAALGELPDVENRPEDAESAAAGPAEDSSESRPEESKSIQNPDTDQVG